MALPPFNTTPPLYVTFILKCESYTLYAMLQWVYAISSSTISFELLAIVISSCINISESFVMPYLSPKVPIVLISIELLAIAISGCINISESFVIPSLGDSGPLPLIFKKIGNMPLFANYTGACPCFDTRLS